MQKGIADHISLNLNPKTKTLMKHAPKKPKLKSMIELCV